MLIATVMFALDLLLVQANNVGDSFTKSGIVPDIITNAPLDEAKVVFQDNIEAELGNDITPTQARKEPKLSWNINNTAYYCVMMTGTNPVPIPGKQFLHWLVVNIPGGTIASGENIATYIGPIPPSKFRYIIFIFEQPGELNFKGLKDTYNSVLSRVNFSVKDFIKKYSFETAVAGNFFFSKFDGTVVRTILDNSLNLI